MKLSIKQERRLTLHSVFSGGRINGTEFADEIDCYLVDEIGDPNYLNSQWYKPDVLTLLNKPQKADVEMPDFKVTLSGVLALSFGAPALKP